MKIVFARHATSRRAVVLHALRAVFLSGSLGLLAMIGLQGVIAGATPDPSQGTISTPAPGASIQSTFVATGTPAASFALPAPSSSPGPGSENTGCFNCHTRIDNTQHDIATAWQASVHGQAGVTCADCHGGDPKSDEVTVAMSDAAGYRGVPSRAETVALCGTCHSDVDRMRQYQIPTDQYSKYKSSVHGQQLLAKGDSRVAICTDCHGVHDVKKASDPTAKVYPLNVPALCASCHADADKMAPYGIPTDQYAIYQQSVHGKALLGNSDMRAPTCASCHGSHDAQPPTSETVVNVCGKCHTATQALYEQSRHSKLDVGPKCWTCHGTHDVQQPSEVRFFHPTPPEIDCTTCHSATDRSLILRPTQFENDVDRRCDTCHHTDSIIYAQAQGIYTALKRASDAYDAAAREIQDAADVGMIVSDADVTLTEAKTSLIRARAAVHTTKLTDVATLADGAVAKADEARTFAEARLSESLFRREAMIVILGIILINVLALILIRRRLSHTFREG
jgi:Cytochrome c552.